ncbi:MAG: xanthine dehydrogenase family protein subunit M [Pseudomonadota bacterium]
MYDFNYHRPASIEDALAALAGAEDGSFMAGGQTMLPTLKQRLAAPSDVIDLQGIAELQGITIEDNEVTIGAMTKHADVAASSQVAQSIPALSHLAGGIGDAQVRNRGTMGGSIANNDPAADYPAAVLGLKATVHTNQRDIAADDFFQGMFETALETNELITQVSFTIPDKAGYIKFPNPASRYAVVGVMVAMIDGQVRVAITGAGPCVFRHSEMEAALNNNFSADALNGIQTSPDELNGDIHASAEYRANLISVMAKRLVTSLE